MRGPRLAAGLVTAYLALVALAYAVGGPPDTCSVGGFGTVTTASGASGTFRVLLAGQPPRGALSFSTSASTPAVMLTAANPRSLRCGAGAVSVTIAGQTGLAGGRTSTYRAEIRPGAGGSADTFRLTLGTGYDSGVAPIRTGFLRIASGAASVSRRSR